MVCIVKDKNGMIQHGVFFGVGEEINLPRVVAEMLEKKKVVAIKPAKVFPAAMKKTTEQEKE